MSMCSIPECKSTVNIWTITNSNPSPPFYQPMDLCHKHLEGELKFYEMYQALVLGRYLENITEPVVTHRGWTLTKKISTWKWLNENTCSQCKRTDSIWKKVVEKWVSDNGPYPYGGYDTITDYFCNTHLPDMGNDPKINGGIYRGTGLSTVEDTWLPLHRNIRKIL